MKRYVILFSVFLCALSIYAQNKYFKNTTKPSFMNKSSGKAQPALAKYRSTNPTLTDEQIAELYVTHVDEKSGRDYKFYAGFGRRSLDAKKDKSKISKYNKSGKVPFRLTATLYEYKEYKGKKVGKRLSGTCKIYILDSEGKLVLKKSSSLSSMCPG